MATENRQDLSLGSLDPLEQHVFVAPAKKINEGEDVNIFLTSKAYTDIMTFLMQLNASMFPRKDPKTLVTKMNPILPESYVYSPPTASLKGMISDLASLIDRAPPDTGPRRFGNISFRKWYELAEEKVDALFETKIKGLLLEPWRSSTGERSPWLELREYLMGSFGSAQRLDYGTGHELSFIAFLAGLWKVGCFAEFDSQIIERELVLGVIDSYLQLIRGLIKTYTLEPAGSHGVWGLDDHSFAPYIFGSAQFSAPIGRNGQVPQEGSAAEAPSPEAVNKLADVERFRHQNMYFGAVGFIYDVKKGPFFEHSPMLYDISGVRAGWAKINKGMIKMYVAEVLSKFPVVQHLPFAHLFQWTQDPTASRPPPSLHTSSQPSNDRVPTAGGMAPTAAPWVSHRDTSSAGATPSAMRPFSPSARAPGPPGQGTSQPGSSTSMAPMRAPWAKDR